MKVLAASIAMVFIVVIASLGFGFGIVWHAFAMGFDAAARTIKDSPDIIDKWSMNRD